MFSLRLTSTSILEGRTSSSADGIRDIQQCMWFFRFFVRVLFVNVRGQVFCACHSAGFSSVVSIGGSIAIFQLSDTCHLDTVYLSSSGLGFAHAIFLKLSIASSGTG